MWRAIGSLALDNADTWAGRVKGSDSYLALVTLEIGLRYRGNAATTHGRRVQLSGGALLGICCSCLIDHNHWDRGGNLADALVVALPLIFRVIWHGKDVCGGLAQCPGRWDSLPLGRHVGFCGTNILRAADDLSTELHAVTLPDGVIHESDKADIVDEGAVRGTEVLERDDLKRAESVTQSCESSLLRVRRTMKQEPYLAIEVCLQLGMLLRDDRVAQIPIGQSRNAVLLRRLGRTTDGGAGT